MIFKFVFLQIEDLQNQIKEAERKVDEKRSILETSQVLECEQDDAEKISFMDVCLCFFTYSYYDNCQIIRNRKFLGGFPFRLLVIRLTVKLRNFHLETIYA